MLKQEIWYKPLQAVARNYLVNVPELGWKHNEKPKSKLRNFFLCIEAIEYRLNKNTFVDDKKQSFRLYLKIYLIF